MPIGETLAEARRQAGLTVAQVSQQTRIRQTIIRAIEDDDYSPCGGDFYARGHIRSIAKVVGTDSEPLISEYDEVYRAPGAFATVSLDELLDASAREPRPRGPDLSAISGVAVSAGAAVRRAAQMRAPRRLAAQAHASSRRLNWTAVLGVALVVVFGFGVYLFVSRSQHVTVSPSAAGKHAAPVGHAGRAHHHRLGSAARNSQSPAAPTPAPAQLIPVSATAFGPNGGDNPQLAPLVLGGNGGGGANGGGGWHTDWYTSASFGGLYLGTGLLLDMGRPVTITAAQITLGPAPGASFQLRIGNTPALSGTRTVAQSAGPGGVVRLHLSSPAHGRYVLVWFTGLPPDQSGTFQAAVYHVSLAGQG
ncbi:MAG TPA: helix-turn-helix transcriptional regulator [Streptosporangiaceae bacterium]